MSLNIKEVENVSKLKPFKRYQYFLRKVADFEELWTIVDENNEISLSHIDNSKLISFWSAKDFIKSNLSGNWKKHKPEKIGLDKLGKKIIPLIIENNYLINVFPVNGKSGFVVNIEEFAGQLLFETATKRRKCLRFNDTGRKFLFNPFLKLKLGILLIDS